MNSDKNKPNDFTEEERRGLYRAIYTRRDVRSEFRKDPIPTDVLAKLLSAAHHAPSVGFMQPWDFIIIDNPELRREIKSLFEKENESAAANYEGERAALYRSLKLEGILDCPLNLCITCDRTRGGPHVLGRNSIIETDLFSACLAVQNLWLAARAEGIGVGWVSIIDNTELSRLLRLPEHVYPLAYLCVGYVSEFQENPELERKGWRSRKPLIELVHRNGWDSTIDDPEIKSAISTIEESFRSSS